MDKLFQALMELARIVRVAQEQSKGEWTFWYEMYADHLMIKGMHRKKKVVVGFNVPFRPHLATDTHNILVVWTTAFMDRCKRGDF